MRQKNTKQKMIKEGMSLLQKHGYHGFSFQDIADKLKIKKPSLYDHYESKDQLILAIIRGYSLSFDEWSASIEDLPPLERIRKIFDVFHSFTSDHSKVCPILSLAADFEELSKPIKEEMNLFVKKWLKWLELQIKEGQRKKMIRTDIKASALASYIYSQGMGSQFQARIFSAPKITLNSGDFVISFLKN